MIQMPEQELCLLSVLERTPVIDMHLELTGLLLLDTITSTRYFWKLIRADYKHKEK